jgi:hypothetical protein
MPWEPQPAYIWSPDRIHRNNRSKTIRGLRSKMIVCVDSYNRQRPMWIAVKDGMVCHAGREVVVKKARSLYRDRVWTYKNSCVGCKGHDFNLSTWLWALRYLLKCYLCGWRVIGPRGIYGRSVMESFVKNPQLIVVRSLSNAILGFARVR